MFAPKAVPLLYRISVDYTQTHRERDTHGPFNLKTPRKVTLDHDHDDHHGFSPCYTHSVTQSFIQKKVSQSYLSAPYLYIIDSLNFLSLSLTLSAVTCSFISHI